MQFKELIEFLTMYLTANNSRNSLQVRHYRGPVSSEEFGKRKEASHQVF